MSTNTSELDPLFAPESVAVVGASPDSTYSSRLIRNLLNYDYGGDVYYVNPNRDTVWDEPCYDTIEAVPETVDLVVVSVPRRFVADVVDEAGRQGVPAAIIISAGFAESDAEGRELESELASVVAEYDIRVCGPNCIGLANMHDETVLTSTCTRKPNPGSIGLVSQSGALAFTTFYERARDEDIDFAYIVSTGNEVDLSVTDYVEYMASDPRVEVICLYIEGIEDPHRFREVAERAVRNGTPVLTVKIGRSETAEAATLSHTGSLTGTDAAWDAVFRQAGVERVEDISDLIHRAAAHASFDPPEGNDVCITSTSGGLASLLADMADERGMELPPIAGETERGILDIEELLTFGEMNNPADIRGYGASVFRQIASHLFDDDSFDAYVFAFGMSAVDERADQLADDLIAVADRASKPVLFLWTGRKEPGELADPQPFERLRKRVPLYYDPDDCMDALASLINHRERADRLANRPVSPSIDTTRDDQSERARASVPDTPRDGILPWDDAKELLDEYGIETVDTRLAESDDEAVAAFRSFSGPVVLKVDSPDIAHRTDIGAIQTGLATEEEVRRAYRTIVSNVREHDSTARISDILVQPMIDDGLELLVGLTRDEVFDSLVTVGTGGTLVETLDDTAHILPPYTASEAREALSQTHVPTLLENRRGKRALDVDEVVEYLEGMSEPATDLPVELELNPVSVTEEGVRALDVLVTSPESDET